MQTNKNRPMYSLYGIALLMKDGLLHQVHENELSIECSAEAGFRIIHNQLNMDYHVMNTLDKILIWYLGKKESLTFDEGKNVFAFRETYTEWLISIAQKKKELKVEEDRAEVRQTNAA